MHLPLPFFRTSALVPFPGLVTRVSAKMEECLSDPVDPWTKGQGLFFVGKTWIFSKFFSFFLPARDQKEFKNPWKIGESIKWQAFCRNSMTLLGPKKSKMSTVFNSISSCNFFPYKSNEWAIFLHLFCLLTPGNLSLCVFIFPKCEKGRARTLMSSADLCRWCVNVTEPRPPVDRRSQPTVTYGPIPVDHAYLVVLYAHLARVLKRRQIQLSTFVPLLFFIAAC